LGENQCRNFDIFWGLFSDCQEKGTTTEKLKTTTEKFFIIFEYILRKL
jgi:hypothetical protein